MWVAALVAAASMQAQTLEKTTGGIKFSTAQPVLNGEVTFYSPSIVRVVKYPSAEMPPKKSYPVILTPGGVDITYRETGDEVVMQSACMSVTLESVAGEKERGTLATILVTSARRSDIALGKILPLACVSLIGAASSFLGVALSLPTLMGVSIDVAIAGVGALEFFFIFLLIVSVVPLIVAAIAAVSTLSRSVKEASSYTSVLMILVMVLSIVASFVSGIGDWVVVIPVLNAVVAMQGALMGAASVWMCLTAVALNLVYTALLVVLIARFLSSERIMFGT